MNRLLATCAVVSTLSLATLAIGMAGLVYVQIEMLGATTEPHEDITGSPNTAGRCEPPSTKT